MSEAPKGLRVDVRRLAAILSSDIAGCSRLMRRNEGETVRELKRVQRCVGKEGPLMDAKRPVRCSTRNGVKGSI